MFLKQTVKRNPELIQLSFWLHQHGIIAPDSYMIDVDTFLENASKMLKEAERRNIKLYFMLKQVGRNPYLARKLMELGYEGAVVVDFKEAKVMMEHQIPIGNAGHLVQIPTAQVKQLVAYRPQVITVYSEEKIRQIDEAAKELGKIQDILLRVSHHTDIVYSGQSAGFLLEELKSLARKVITIYQHVRIVGVTSFPCYLYDDTSKDIVSTENLATVKKAAGLLTSMGLACEMINTPSATCTHNLRNIEMDGGTCGEPGHGLTGTTPMHAIHDLEEDPCVVYVSEISHNFKGQSYCFGGGHYRRSHMKSAIVGKTMEHSEPSEVIAPADDSIDYHFNLTKEYPVGDTVIMAFRHQMFVTRSDVVLVEGLKKREPEIIGIYDTLGRRK